MNNKQFVAVVVIIVFFFLFKGIFDAGSRENKTRELETMKSLEAFGKDLKIKAENDLKLKRILVKYEKEEIPRLTENRTLAKEDKRFLILYLKIKELAEELPVDIPNIERTWPDE